MKKDQVGCMKKGGKVKGKKKPMMKPEGEKSMPRLDKFARGGVPKMTAGAGGAKGRLEKAKFQKEDK